MQPGLRGPDRDTEVIGYLDQRQAEVVMEDEDGPLLEGEAAKRPLELVAVIDGQDVAGLPVHLDGQKPYVGGPATTSPGLRVALIGHDPVEPGLETVGVAERTQLSPRNDQRGLHRIFREVGIAEDPARDHHAPIADDPCKGVERLAVTLLRSVHERCMHPRLLREIPPVGGDHPEEGSARPDGSFCAPPGGTDLRVAGPSATVGRMLRVGSIVIRVDDLDLQRAFWTATLDYLPRDGDDDTFALLRPRDGTGPNVSLDRVRSSVQVPPRIHLDLYADDQAAEVERLLGLGATEVQWDKRPADADYVILADPEGNRFCVIDAAQPPQEETT